MSSKGNRTKHGTDIIFILTCLLDGLCGPEGRNCLIFMANRLEKIFLEVTVSQGFNERSQSWWSERRCIYTVAKAHMVNGKQPRLFQVLPKSVFQIKTGPQLLLAAYSATQWPVCLRRIIKEGHRLANKTFFKHTQWKPGKFPEYDDDGVKYKPRDG